MPLYDFKCSKCGIKFEKFLFNSNEKTKCKHCGNRAEKLIKPGLSSFSSVEFSPSDSYKKDENKTLIKV